MAVLHDIGQPRGTVRVDREPGQTSFRRLRTVSEPVLSLLDGDRLFSGGRPGAQDRSEQEQACQDMFQRRIPS
ncbi:TPA: hypothetical protein DCE37_17035 [Candidatus Latescibacteria bacterium]|nr:hypothetical protein [Candidatus Latescibacterota bacterium]